MQLNANAAGVTPISSAPVDLVENAVTAFNVNAATVVKAGAGKVVRLSVITAGAVGTVNDCLTTGAAAIGNQIAVIPAAVGIISLDWPFYTGLVIVPGAGQVLAVEYI